MKKHFLTVLALGVLGACAGVEQAAQQEVASFTQASVTQQAQQVQLVMQQPAADCVFKGGILGDANPDASGLIRGVTDLSAQVAADLRNNAANMGGNTVWVRGANWHNTDVSYDYDSPFVVNNVQYSALVYQCPAK